MRDTVDYRLLERFDARRRLNLEPPEPQCEQKVAVGSADGRRGDDSWRRVRVLDLRD